MIQAELGQVAASIETLVARQTNLGYKLSKLGEREDDLADTCESIAPFRHEEMIGISSLLKGLTFDPIDILNDL